MQHSHCFTCGAATVIRHLAAAPAPLAAPTCRLCRLLRRRFQRRRTVCNLSHCRHSCALGGGLAPVGCAAAPRMRCCGLLRCRLSGRGWHRGRRLRLRRRQHVRGGCCSKDAWRGCRQLPAQHGARLASTHRRRVGQGAPAASGVGRAAGGSTGGGGGRLQAHRGRRRAFQQAAQT